MLTISDRGVGLWSQVSEGHYKSELEDDDDDSNGRPPTTTVHLGVVYEQGSPWFNHCFAVRRYLCIMFLYIQRPRVLNLHANKDRMLSERLSEGPWITTKYVKGVGFREREVSTHCTRNMKDRPDVRQFGRFPTCLARHHVQY